MAIAAVSRVRGSGAAGSTTVAPGATFVATAGNLLWAWIQWQGTTWSGIADTAGNTWNIAGAQFDPGSNHTRLYYAYNCLGHATNTVTATFAGSATYRAIVVHQFSGVGTASDPLLDNKEASGSSAAPATASLSIGAATEAVILAGITSNSNSNVAGTGYTGVAFNATGDSVNYFMDEYHIVTASEAATATCTNAGWYIKAAMFAAAASGGGGRIFKLAGEGGGLAGPARGLAGRASDERDVQAYLRAQQRGRIFHPGIPVIGERGSYVSR